MDMTTYAVLNKKIKEVESKGVSDERLNDAVSNSIKFNELNEQYEHIASEIVQARGEEVNLNARLTKFDSQLETIKKQIDDNNIVEIQNRTLAFENDNIINLSNDVQDCTCNISFTTDSGGTGSGGTGSGGTGSGGTGSGGTGSGGEEPTTPNVPAFTNMLPFNPLSSAPSSPNNGIQAYKGNREFIDDNIIKFTATADGAIFKSLFSFSGLTPGHKIYSRCFMSNDGISWELSDRNLISTVKDDGTIPATNLFNITGITNGTVIYIKNPLIVNLSEMYGVGQEPTLGELITKIPMDVWSNGTYEPTATASVFSLRPLSDTAFTLTSKNPAGQVVDTYVSTSTDYTLDIVSGGKVESSGGHPSDLKLMNVKTRVLISSGNNSGNNKEYEGIKWVGLGDSITDSTINATIKYHHHIVNKTGITFVDFGKGGTGYKRTEESLTCFYQRAENIPSDADLVTIMGSINDWKLLNKYNADYDGFVEGNASDTFDKNSLCGYINKCIDVVREKAPNARIGLITPPPSFLENYIDRIRPCIVNVGKYRHIPVLDLWEVANLSPRNTILAQEQYWDAGKEVMCHPSNEGHKIFYPQILAFIRGILG